MSKPKPSPADRERFPHQIKWGDEDWEQIQAAAARLTEQEHDTVTPTSVIRRATRIFVKQLLGKQR